MNRFGEMAKIDLKLPLIANFVVKQFDYFLSPCNQFHLGHFLKIFLYQSKNN